MSTGLWMKGFFNILIFTLFQNVLHAIFVLNGLVNEKSNGCNQYLMDKVNVERIRCRWSIKWIWYMKNW